MKFARLALIFCVPPATSAACGTAGSLDIRDIADLPLVEVPASAGQTDSMAVMVSGDGGWASLDKQVSEVLAGKGIPVVGLNSLKYYWQPRPPEASALALARIVRHYPAKWQKSRVLLIGYSRGADVLPFMASRLPEDLMSQVTLIALLGPATSATFEFHVSDWLHNQQSITSPLQPEIEKLRGKAILCVYGDNETDTVCPLLPAGLAILDKRPGAQHFGGTYRSIAERIVTEAAD